MIGTILKWVIYLGGGFIVFACFNGIVASISEAARGFSTNKQAFESSVMLLILALVFGFLTWYLGGQSWETWKLWAAHVFDYVKEHKAWFIGASIASTLGFISMGLTGGLFMVPLDWILEHTLVPKFGWKRPHGDTMWPMALGYAILMPWWAFGVSLTVRYFFQDIQMMALSLSTAGGTSLIALIIHIIYRSSNG